MAKAAVARVIRLPSHNVAPVIKVSAPRAAPHKKKHHRRHGVSQDSPQQMLGIALAGFVLGKIDASNMNIPTLPVLGRAGTLALGLYYAGKSMKSKMVRDGAKAAAAIAGYEYGKTGSISGGNIARQV